MRAIRGDAHAYTYCNTEFNSHSDAYGNLYTQPNAHPNPMHGEMYTDTPPSPHPGTAPVA